MTIAFEPSKQLVLKAAKTAIGFVQEHVQVSVKTTPDGITLTGHVRWKGKRRPQPTA